MTVRTEMFAALIFAYFGMFLSQAVAQVAAPEPPAVAAPEQSKPEEKQPEATPTTLMVDEAKKCLVAFDKQDFEGIIDSMHSRMTKKMGGKEAAVALVERAMKGMNEQLGDSKMVVTLGKPGEIVEAGDFHFSYVKKNTKMVDGEGETIVDLDGYLFGISEDDGVTWKFLDSGAGAAAIRKVFPELPETFSLPDEES